jgi:1-acyl-sn-glycerol-3-phosphate acyltransferase
VKARTLVIALVSAIFVTLASIAVIPIAVVTLFAKRRLYAAYTTGVARVLLRLWGVRVRVHGDLSRIGGQVVYVSNHSSTLDLFVLVALGLPNTRFFLSGFLQKFVPLAILARLMGTFFTVPQEHQEERRRIFARASRELARTGESVYLSPEGGRIVNGQIGPFNKGAFHMAASLQAPIVPLYFLIPSAIDPGLGYAVRPGTVDVFVKPAIDTSGWTTDDIATKRDLVRALFVGWHDVARHLRHAEPPVGIESPLASFSS